jgi:hypothetical protein
VVAKVVTDRHGFSTGLLFTSRKQIRCRVAGG